MKVGEVVDCKGREPIMTHNDLPSLTVQADRDMADIRHILGKYRETGIVPSLNRAEAQFRDISEFTDYADAMRNLKVAEREFMRLPARARKVFGNDVAKWLDAAHDPEKRALLVAAGLLPEPEVAPGGDTAGAADPAAAVPAAPEA